MTRSRRLLAILVALTLACGGVVPVSVFAATGPRQHQDVPLFTGDPTTTDGFSRYVAGSLGTSEINGLFWNAVATPISPVDVDGSAARWRLNYPVADYEDNSWHLDLQSANVTLPFEAVVTLTVTETFQATSLDDIFNGFVYLTGNLSGAGVGDDGSTARLEIYQRPSTSNTLNLYPLDSRQRSGAYQSSEGSLAPGFWQGQSIRLRLRVDSQGVYGRIWAATDAEPTTWQASWSGDPSIALRLPYRYFGVTFFNTGTDDPTVDVAVDSIELSGMTPAAATPDLPVMFIHGINGSFNDPGFPTLLPEIQLRTQSTPRVFHYYQDIGSRDPDTGVCSSESLVLPAQPNGGMPVDLQSTGDSICDSQGNVTLMVTKLHQDIQQLYYASGRRKIVLIGNSEGGTLIRGLLAYSAELNDDVASTMVDSAIFLESDHAGSKAGRDALNGFMPDRLIGEWIGGLDFSRPAVEDLSSQSAWYEWANPPPNHVPDLPYFNVYGDMRIVPLNCFLVWCSEYSFPVGDGLILPGQNDPHAVLPEGGARFLPNGTHQPQRWQWGLPKEFPFVVSGAGGAFGFIGELNVAANDPIFHGNFSNSLDQIQVQDCGNDQQVALDEELLRVTVGRVTESPYLCTP